MDKRCLACREPWEINVEPDGNLSAYIRAEFPDDDIAIKVGNRIEPAFIPNPAFWTMGDVLRHKSPPTSGWVLDDGGVGFYNLIVHCPACTSDELANLNDDDIGEILFEDYI
jgi:hypothetical protein